MRPRQTGARRRSPSLVPQLDLGRKHRPDYWILVWCSVLLVIGLVVVYSISPALAQTNHVSNNFYLVKQLIAIVLGIVAFIVAYKIPLATWRQSIKPLLILAGLATALALVMPVNPSYPAHRWVRLGSLSFQSVELVKFVGLIWLSGFLADRIKQGNITNFNKTFKPLMYVLVGALLVVAGVQSDLGSAGVIVAIVGVMAFIAGLPMKRLLLIGGVIIIGGVLFISIAPYRVARVEAYLHPQSNCQGSGYQACQALIAVGSGGLMGLGLGNSVQAYGYLPEADNDSIFAIYSEKFGFVGATILIVIFLAFFTRIKNVAERTNDDFTRLLVIGIFTWLGVQTIVNVGAMLGLLPLKGITLPFISYGGTSVVFSTTAIGLVFQASQYTSFSSKRVGADPGPVQRDFRSNSFRRGIS